MRVEKIYGLIAQISFVFILTACGGSDSSSDGDSASAPDSAGDGAPAFPSTPPSSITNTAPVVEIEDPMESMTVAAGETVTFTASAQDSDDGVLDAAIEWDSSIDGDIGTGRQIDTDLSIGSHLVTASIADRGGLSDAESVLVVVQEPVIPENNLPVVTIAIPEGTSFTEDEAVILNGRATDVEDGNLTSSIRWFSSIDGALPIAGGTFNRQLSVGTHSITASVVDSNGASGLKGITVNVLSSQLAANAYYVDVDHPNASDSNPGTEDLPWESIDHAAGTLEAGEIVYIKEGIYLGDVDVENSGTRGNEIVFSAYPGDERKAVIYDGMFSIRGESHIKVLGLKVEKSDHRGFYVEGPEDPDGPPSENITFANNHTYDTYSSAFSVWGRPYEKDPGNFVNVRDLVIENNLIEKANNGGHNENITLAMGVVNAHVRYNEITTGGDPSNGGEGIDFKDGVRDSYIYGNLIHGLNRRGIYVDGGRTEGGFANNIHIYGNIVYNDPSSAIMVSSEGVGDVDGVYIYNNVVVGAGQNGIGVYDHPRGRGISTVKNIAIFNNTVVDGGRDGSGWGNIGTNHPEAENMLIRNNVTWGGNGFDIKGEGDTIVEDNLCRESFCEVRSNPQFINPTFDLATADYRLQADSPAIDAGSSVDAPAFDFDGRARPQGSGIDLGAYEYKR